MRLPNNLRVQTDFGSYNNSQAGPSSRYDQEYERHRSHGHDHGHKHNRRHKHRDERNDRDRHTRHYRLHTPPPVTKGPALPEHMVKHYKLVADKMRSGRHPPMPTYLVGLLSTDKFTQERARSILRGVTCDLMDSLVVLVDKEATRGGERPVDLFKTIEKHFDLQEGQVFKLWAFDSIHDRMPREIKTLRDVLKFIKDRLWAAESLGVASHEHVDPLGELICHFVVETGECHPRLFDVTYEDDEGEEAELKEVKEVECQGDKSKSDVTLLLSPTQQAERLECAVDTDELVLNTFEGWREEEKYETRTYQEWQLVEAKQKEMLEVVERKEERKTREREPTRETKAREDRNTYDDWVRQDNLREEKRRREYAEIKERDKERFRDRMSRTDHSDKHAEMRERDKERLSDRMSRSEYRSEKEGDKERLRGRMSRNEFTGMIGEDKDRLRERTSRRGYVDVKERDKGKLRERMAIPPPTMRGSERERLRERTTPALSTTRSADKERLKERMSLKPLVVGNLEKERLRERMTPKTPGVRSVEKEKERLKERTTLKTTVSSSEKSKDKPSREQRLFFPFS